MIELRNIDLSGVTILEQMNKVEEEANELCEADYNRFYAKSEDIEKCNEELIEEWWDRNQAELGGYLLRYGLTAQDFMDYYPKHLKKLENRPRDKKNI